MANQLSTSNFVFNAKAGKPGSPLIFERYYGTSYRNREPKPAGIVQIWVADVNSECDMFFYESDYALVELRFSYNRVYTKPGTITKKVKQFFGVDINRLLGDSDTETEFLFDGHTQNDGSKERWTDVVFHCKSKKERMRIANELKKALKALP